MKSLGPILGWAAVAAIGNAIFVFGSRKSGSEGSAFGFIICTLLAACVILGGAAALTRSGSVDLARTWPYVLAAGLGTAITYVGFQNLFATQGAGGYSIYAMMALLTTSIGVAVIVFREKFNLYHGLAMVCAIGALFLFYLGQTKTANDSAQPPVAANE